MESAKSKFYRYSVMSGLDIVKELIPQDMFKGYPVHEDVDSFYEACELGESEFFDDLWKAIERKITAVCKDTWEGYKKDEEMNLMDIIFVRVVADMKNIVKWFNIIPEEV